MNTGKSLYFFAVVPPEEVQFAVTRIKEDFRDNFNASHALKSPPHITLIPPFKYDSSKEDLLVDSLNEFAEGEMEFIQSLDGFGSFPPRVIFIKVIPNQQLNELHDRLMQYMDEVIGITGLIRNQKGFSPHMTVAFRDLTRANFFLARSKYDKMRIHYEFKVDGICLLKHSGKRWEIIRKGAFKNKNSMLS